MEQDVDCKYAELDNLLEKTSVYSQFLIERLKERVDDHGSELPHSKRRKKDQRAESKKLYSILENSWEDDLDIRRVETHETLFQQPKLITGATLRNYQLAGVEWMVSLFENGINGILADEMGLGKTLQTIGFLCYLRERGVNGPFLVVAPKSVINNWDKEIKTCAPVVPSLVYYGTPDQRKRMARSLLRKPDASYPVVITTYEIVMQDRSKLSKVGWKYVVIDEAQRIKNFECKLLKELKKYQSANRLLLTGTPLQNDLAELWSLLNFLLPEIFDDLSAFQSWFDFGNRGNGDEDLSLEVLEKEKKDRLVTKLHKILRPFLLRRLKSEVEQVLPPKKEFILYAQLKPQQNKYYKAAYENRLHEVVQNLRGPQSDRLRFRYMQLRKACGHPYLFEEVDEWGEPTALLTDEHLVQASGKLELMDRLLKRLLQRKHRIIIFSQFTALLDIIEDMMVLRGYGFSRIDGQTSLEDRTAQMDSFNNVESLCSIFLISTRAGGLGITLTAADTVIFYDSDYNPQVDLQAMDRCHRIGQTRPVHVYRLVTAGTVEESLIRIANRKRQLEHVVVSKGRFSKVQTEHAEEDDDTLESILRIRHEDNAQKAITDNDIDRIVELRPTYYEFEPLESIVSKVSEEPTDGLSGDGFEMIQEHDSSVFDSR